MLIFSNQGLQKSKYIWAHVKSLLLCQRLDYHCILSHICQIKETSLRKFQWIKASTGGKIILSSPPWQRNQNISPSNLDGKVLCSTLGFIFVSTPGLRSSQQASDFHHINHKCWRGGKCNAHKQFLMTLSVNKHSPPYISLSETKINYSRNRATMWICHALPSSAHLSEERSLLSAQRYNGDFYCKASFNFIRHAEKVGRDNSFHG